MKIFALFVCTQLLGRCGIPARILPVPGVGLVPNAFSTLTLCQEYATRYLGSPPDKHGRWHLRPGGFWECLERQVNVWQQPK
jgi:hypothetical protein